MKYILAPDSFKGTMTSKEVIKIMKKSILSDSEADIVEIPIADGGEGTVDTIIDILSGEEINCEVHDPLMRKVESHFGVVDDTAIIEMALASGITLLSEDERNPLVTTTYGTGELIVNALDRGVKKIIIGIGGSATNDGGMGMACALGVNFLDVHGDILPHGGRYLEKIDFIDTSNMDARIKNVKIEVICDVNNPFTGENGATYTYGPQKGGDKKQLERLENGMICFSDIIRKQYDIDLNLYEGAGAAGGLGGGLVIFLNGKLKSGIETILNLTNFEEHLKSADIVITGEGKLDEQSLQGKVINGIINRVKDRQCKLIVVAGHTHLDHIDGVDYIISTTDKPLSEEKLIKECRDNLKSAMKKVMEIIRENL